MDIWSKKKRSAVMAKIKGKDTKPEWIVRRYLFSRGYRYRKNVKGLPGTPDIVLRKYGIVIFIHGCFWHGHEVDGTMPKTNREFWKNKIEGNKLRDKRNKEKLRKMGWSVITVWECQLKSAVRQQTLLEIEYYINHTYLERFSLFTNSCGVGIFMICLKQESCSRKSQQYSSLPFEVKIKGNGF